jgi:hypothetical protein
MVDISTKICESRALSKPLDFGLAVIPDSDPGRNGKKNLNIK